MSNGNLWTKSFNILVLSSIVCISGAAAGPQASSPSSDVSIISLSALPNPPRMMEGYPDNIQANLETRDRFLRNLPPSPEGMHAEFVIRTIKKWSPGQTIKVAFMGGNPTLHKEIANAAAEWTKYGNIKLDFGLDQQSGKYREWSATDSEYKAEVRISFNYGGYWSLVGNDSDNSSIVSPSQPSMNFGGFDVSRPSDWMATVLHEFGHALGFEHEHQHPIGGCDLDFRWDDDRGYVATFDSFGQYITDSQGRRPGIYTVLGGPPNRWSKSKVDYNLKQLTSSDSHAFTIGPFDRDSIMKYYFEPWMFRDGEKSHCYSKENQVLSPQDQKGLAMSYPKGVDDIGMVTATQEKALNSFVKSQIIAPQSMQRYEKQLKYLKKE